MSDKNNTAPQKKTFDTNQLIAKFLPYVLMLVVAMITLFLYFKPATKSGVVLNQQDILQGKGMSKEIHDFRKATGEEPLWTSRMFSGMPAYQISTLYHGNLFSGVDQVMKLRFLLAHPITIMFVLFLGMFILFCSLRINPYLSAAGAMAFTFSSYFFIAMEAGHNSKINAIAYVPGVLAGVLMLYRKRYFLGAALTMLFVALQINANHFQITFYMFFIIGFLFLSEFLGPKLFIRLMAVIVSFLVFIYTFMLNSGSLDTSDWIVKQDQPGALMVGLAILQFLGVLGWIGYDFYKNRPKLDIEKQKEQKKHWVIARGLVGAAIVLTLLPNIGRLLTTYEYSKETNRAGSKVQEDEKRRGNNDKLQQNPQTSQQTSKGLSKTYAYDWSYGVAETFTLITPFYMGDASGSKLSEDSETHEVLSSMFGKSNADNLVQNWPTYYGTQPFTSGPVYIGAIVIFLFILGLIVVPERYRWWLLAATVLSIFLSWGKNWQWFSDLFFDNIPMYNSFRAVSMTLVIAEICMPIMATLALWQFFTNPKKLSEKDWLMKIGIAGGATIFLLLVLLIAKPGTYNFSTGSDEGIITNVLQRLGVANPQPGMKNQLIEALEADRAGLFTSGIFRSMIFVLLGGGFMIAFMKWIRPVIKSDGKKPLEIIFGLGMMTLFMIDLVPICYRYLDHDDFIKESQFLAPVANKSKADEFILKDTDPDYRVLNLSRNTWNDGFTPYYHKSIGGYHAAKLRYYNDLISYQLDNEKAAIINALNSASTKPDPISFLTSELNKLPCLKMLNCKYVIYHPDAPPLVNQSRLGNAWIVSEYEIVKDAVDGIKRVGEIDPAKTLVVHEEDAEQIKGFSVKKDPMASIRLTAFAPNHITYDYNAPSGQEQLVAFSEVYYNSGKGWQAYVDNMPVDHFRADYVLRAMRVPGGKHTIDFKFEPKSYSNGETYSLFGSLLVFALIIGAVYMDYKKGGSEKELEEMEKEEAED